MKDHLKERIQEFSKSLDKVHFLDRAIYIQRFIEQELSARDVPYTVTAQDLYAVRDNAAQESINSHDPNGLAMWWTMGVLKWLRSKDMLYFKVGGQNGVVANESNDPNSNRS